MKTNPVGVALIKKFEGCKLDAYQCPAGVWTVGWGHTGEHVTPGTKISQHQADVILNSDLDLYEQAVEEFCPGASSNQFSALVSFAYNLGINALIKSTLRRRFLAADVDEAADEFLRWTRAAGRVLPGLVKRREAERALFLTPELPEGS